MRRSRRVKAILVVVVAAGCAPTLPSSTPSSAPTFAPHASEVAPSLGSSASPTPSPRETPGGTSSAVGEPVESTAEDGGFKLTLRAKQRYREGEAINAVIILENARFAEAPFVLSAGSPLVALSVADLAGDRRAGFESDGGCAPFGYWERGRPTVIEFRMRWSYGVHATPESLRPFVEGDELTLPAGTWILRAQTRLFGPECDSPERVAQLDAEVTVVVEP
jgi:hypothetical protein